MTPEPLLYHDATAKGFFSVLVNKQQKSYRLADIERVLVEIPMNAAVYISQGEFFLPNRRIVNLSRLPLLFADLDTHTTRYGALNPEQQAKALVMYCEEIGLLRPSFVNFSGRGLHPKWLLDSPIRGSALPRWNAVQKEKTKRLAPFGADPAARDASRCLRMVGTLNERTGERCRTVYPEDPSAALVAYDFEELCLEILPFSRPELEEAKQKREEKRTAHAAGRMHPNLWTPRQLWWSRLDDIRRLIALRGWEAGVPEGYRNSFLLVASYAVAWGAQPAHLEREIFELASQMTPSLPMSEVRSMVRQVRSHPPHKMQSETIIERLQIQPDEQRHLKTLISDEFREERRKTHDRERHRKGDDDQQTRERKATEERQEVCRLHAQGMPYKAIGEQMGLTVKQVANRLQYAKRTA